MPSSFLPRTLPVSDADVSFLLKRCYMEVRPVWWRRPARRVTPIASLTSIHPYIPPPPLGPMPTLLKSLIFNEAGFSAIFCPFFVSCLASSGPSLIDEPLPLGPWPPPLFHRHVRCGVFSLPRRRVSIGYQSLPPPGHCFSRRNQPCRSCAVDNQDQFFFTKDPFFVLRLMAAPPAKTPTRGDSLRI